jgi:hypothetical protein
MVGFNSTTCQYYREDSKDDKQYTLVKTTENVGLKINYKSVQETGEEINLWIYCNNKLGKAYNFVYKNYTSSGDSFDVVYESLYICPQVISNIVFDFFNSFIWIFFVAGLLLGLSELFYGSVIFSVTIFLVF